MSKITFEKRGILSFKTVEMIKLFKELHLYDDTNLFETRMHSSRMPTARSSSRLGGLHQAHTPPGADTPGSRHPPGASTPLEQAQPPRTRPPLDQTPPEQTSPPVNRMTNRCKNITLLQTSFAGGNNLIVLFSITNHCR